MATLSFSRTKINPHEALSPEKLEKIFEIARSKSPQVHALISLLHTCALRIQDVVGLTFSSITQQKADKDGFITLHLPAKKSTARIVMIDKETINAVKAYQDRMDPSEIMFSPGNGKNPANKWNKMLTKFYMKNGI